MPDTLYDVVIIGGGPAGLAAAQYAARARMKTVVLDKSKTAGALAFAGRIENYPGLVPPLPGKELLEIFRNQAIEFGAEYVNDAQVVGVSVEGDVKEVFTMDNSYKGKTLIIATGSMGRKATIKGEAELLGKGASYCAICDAAFFKGKTVCVLGDSEEAVKEAGLLTRFAATVYLIAPSQKLKAPEDHPALEAENLKVILGRTVREITGLDTVDSVLTVDKDGKEERIMLEGVFVYIQGSKPIVDYLGETVRLGESGCIETDRYMATSVPGVYAAGDVTCTEVRQVIISAADGAMAALSVEKFVHGKKRLKADWSKSGEQA